MVLTPNMASENDQRDNYMNIKDCLWFVVQHAVNVLSNRAVLQPRIDKPMFICDNATHNQHNNSCVVVTAYSETRLGVIECFTVKMVKLYINYNTKMCDYRAYASPLIKYDRDQALINLMRAQFRN